MEALQSINILTGQSFLQELCDILRDLGYNVQAMIIRHSIFVRNSRSRIFIFGMSEAAGGAAAAAWAAQRVQAITQARSAKPPTEVFDIIDIKGPEENMRIAAAQACPLAKGGGGSSPPL